MIETNGINRAYDLEQVSKVSKTIINRLYDELLRRDYKIKDLENELKRTENNRRGLALAYAKKLNILITKAQYKKLYRRSRKELKRGLRCGGLKK